MKTPTQTTLPGIRNFCEPQTVPVQSLTSIIAEANAAGFEAIRMECLKHNTGYKVTFQRMADASEGRGARPADTLDTTTKCAMPPIGMRYWGCQNKSKESLASAIPARMTNSAEDRRDSI